MDALVKAAVNEGQVLVDLQDHNIRVPQDPLSDAGGAGEVEIAVPVHGRGAHHGDIHVEEVAVVGNHIAEDHRDVVAQAIVAQLSLIGGAVPAVVDKMLPFGVRFHDLDRAKSQIAADFDIGELIAAGGQRFVEQGGKANVGAVVDPVAALNAADSLLRRS